MIEAASFRKISAWSLWIGVPMMVTSGLLPVLLAVEDGGARVQHDHRVLQAAHRRPTTRWSAIEVPGSWFIGGYAVLGIAVIALGHALFHITWWMGVDRGARHLLPGRGRRRASPARPTSPPVGPLSARSRQLTFGAIKPGDVTVNLMTANITAGATSHAGDLLTDLKSGYLLGANPRQQFIAQFFGVLAGGLVVIPAFFTPDPRRQHARHREWPAPAALVWRGVAELLAKGMRRAAAVRPASASLVGSVLGIIIPVLEMKFPKQKKYIPSATGLGLAFTINGFNSISFFIGSCSRCGSRRCARRWPRSTRCRWRPGSSPARA